MTAQDMDRLELTDEQIDEFAEYYFGREFFGDRGMLLDICNQAKAANRRSKLEVEPPMADPKPIARPVCPVTHKECSAAEPCHAPECELAVI